MRGEPCAPSEHITEQLFFCQLLAAGSEGRQLTFYVKIMVCQIAAKYSAMSLETARPDNFSIKLTVPHWELRAKDNNDQIVFPTTP